MICHMNLYGDIFQKCFPCYNFRDSFKKFARNDKGNQFSSTASKSDSQSRTVPCVISFDFFVKVIFLADSVPRVSNYHYIWVWFEFCKP